MAETKQSPPKPAIIQGKPGYNRVPNFWIDTLTKLDVKVPASFWLFMFVLWRKIMGGNKDLAAAISLDDFVDHHVGRESAVKWKNAIEVSNLFDVTTGTEDGDATSYKYRIDATTDDWEDFYLALAAACKERYIGADHFRLRVSALLARERGE